MRQVARSGRHSRGWGTQRRGAILDPGFIFCATGMTLPTTLLQTETVTEKLTVFPIRIDPSSVKFDQQFVLRGGICIMATTIQLLNQVIRYFVRNARTDGWAELKKNNIYGTSTGGWFISSSGGSTTSAMIPLTRTGHDHMISPERFAGLIGATQSKRMDLSHQSLDGGR